MGLAAAAAGATPTGKKKSLWAPGMACDSLGSFANFIAFCLFDRLETGLTLAELDSIRCVVEASDDGSDAALPFAHWRPIGTDDNADENVTQDGFDEKAENIFFRAVRNEGGASDGSAADEEERDVSCGDARSDKYWARRLWTFMSKVRELKTAPKREKDLDDPENPWLRRQ